MKPITSFFSPNPKAKKPSERPNEERSGFDKKRDLDQVFTAQSTKNDSGKRQKNQGEGPSSFLVNSLVANGDLSPEVEDLISHLDGDVSEENTWRSKLRKHVSSSGFDKLAKFVSTARKKETVYPPQSDTFSALNLTPLDQVKVVIVGQDPYFQPNQGHGLCFSVRKGIRVPPSLGNIYKELGNDPEINFLKPQHGCLELWAKQGVLLLNTVLTVRRGDANSHKNKGWEQFTDQVIRIVNRENAEKGVVFLLWGKPAAKKANAIVSKGSKHTIICTSHPSPLGATKTASPFLGSKCFSRCNNALEKMGHTPIDWNEL